VNETGCEVRDEGPANGFLQTAATGAGSVRVVTGQGIDRGRQSAELDPATSADTLRMKDSGSIGFSAES